MNNTIQIIADSLNSHNMGILSMTTDTLVHKVYNISPPSNLKLVDWLKPSVDILIALIGAIILILSYLHQKRKEFKEKIIESKRIAYSEFLKDFTETALNITYDKKALRIEDDRRRINARNLILLYGNDKVIRAYNVWIEYSDKAEASPGSDKDVELFGKFLIEIRKDIHGNSIVTNEEIKNLNPFYRG